MVARLIKNKKVQVTLRVNNASDCHQAFHYAVSSHRIHTLVDALYQNMREQKIPHDIVNELARHFDDVSFKEI